MCILFVNMLLKVVSDYDLSVPSMSVMGFSKKSLDRGWVGGEGSDIMLLSTSRQL